MRSDVAIYIVDDDEAIRDSLNLLMESVGLNATCFASAHAFLDGYDASKPACLILDVRMPDISGLDLQRILNERQIQIPIVIITGHGDVPIAVRAMKAGAMDVLEKPFNDQALLDAITNAVTKSNEAFEEQNSRAKLKNRTQHLSPREREIMDLLILGKSSKKIAAQLGISPKTVDVHRIHIMEKMEVKSIVELARLVASSKK
ncbi:MAG: response regulator [Gammaproteobacteria bacterium]|jgi:two-component system, LuxR family, response regulator FixJ